MPRPPCSRRSPAPCSPAATRCPGCSNRIREAFGLTSVAILQRQDGRLGRSRRAPDRAECARPEQADVDVAVDARHPPRRPAAAPWPPPSAACSTPSPARPCSRCATSRSAPRPPRRSRRADATELRTRAAVGGRPRPAHAARVDQGRRRAACATRTCSCPRPTASELAATVEESADRLTGVVNNLLDSSRLATGAVTPELQPVALRRGRARSPCAGSTAPTASASRSTSDLPEVLADPGLLERVVANLVDNALRHGRGSPVTPARQRARATASSCVSSTPARVSPEARPTACSPRSSGSATGSRAGSASGSASPAGSPRPWAARSPPRTLPAEG